MKIKRYFAGHRAQYNDDQAATLGKVLESLGGEVEPQQLVAAARNKRSGIHDLFEWDDKKAGDSYRVMQARDHIRHLQVEIVNKGKTAETRAFHSVIVSKSEDHAKRAYSPVQKIAKSTELREQVIAQAHRELVSWRTRWEQYKDIFGDVFEVIDGLDAAA